MEEDLIGCLAPFIGIIAAIGLAIVVIRFIFVTIIGGTLRIIVMLFRSYHFSMLLALIFFVLFLTKMENMEKNVTPLKDSANNILEKQLIDLVDLNNDNK